MYVCLFALLVYLCVTFQHHLEQDAGDNILMKKVNIRKYKQLPANSNTFYCLIEWDVCEQTADVKRAVC